MKKRKVRGKNCALIPAYNEEANIKEVVEKVKKMRILPLVIDDASKDRTYEIAKKTGAVVLRHKKNKGKGEGIKTGIQHILEKMPSVRNFVLIDADMQYEPSEAPKLLRKLETAKADIVVGYRNWDTVPFRHRLGNFVWRTSFNILFGTDFKDTNCGMMAMTRDTADVVMEALHGGYIIENSILSNAVRKKLRIRQVPVKVVYKHKSEVRRGIRMVGGILIFIVKEGLRYRLGQK